MWASLLGTPIYLLGRKQIILPDSVLGREGKMLELRRGWVLLIVILLPAASRNAIASVFNASVSEQTGATAKDSPDPQMSDPHSNTLLPPIDLSSNATSGTALAASGITISSYIGPVNGSANSAGLTLSGNTTASTFHDPGDLTSASASFTFNFSLDAMQTYTFGRSDTSVLLTGPGGDVAQGPGTLLPGDYTLTLSSSASLGFDTQGSSFGLTIAPEPASVALAGFAAIALLRRRKNTY
jgi:MYXO-CTERM domain-containing protein